MSNTFIIFLKFQSLPYTLQALQVTQKSLKMTHMHVKIKNSMMLRQIPYQVTSHTDNGAIKKVNMHIYAIFAMFYVGEIIVHLICHMHDHEEYP